MRCWPIVLPMLLTLAGCGAEGARQSPIDVHSAWIAALRGNDRQAAQALLADDAELSIDRALEQAQYLVNHGPEGVGVLVAVDVEAPTAEGAGQVGRSIWRLERLNSCFVTTLAETDSGWRVTGYAERQTGCPSGGG